MLDWFDRKARWRARWQRWWPPIRDRVEAWRQHRQEAAAEPRMARRRPMVNPVVEEGIQQAVAKTLLGQMSGDVIQHLLRELWEQQGDTLRAEALAQVREEMAQELAASEERLKDRYARQLKEHERDLDRQADVTEARLREELEQEYSDRIGRLRHARDTWKHRAEQAEAQLVALLTQLLSEDRRRYLHDSHIDRLDVADLNGILARYGYAVRSAARPSERRVQVRLSSGQVADRHVFWLERVPAGSMPKPEADEADDEADAEA